MTTIRHLPVAARWPPESQSASQPRVVGFRNPSARAEKIVVEARHVNTQKYFCDFVYANNYSTSMHFKTSRCVSMLCERIRDTIGNKTIIIKCFVIFLLWVFSTAKWWSVMCWVTSQENFSLRTHCNLVEVWFRILRILLFLSYYVVPSATLMPRYPFNINTIQRFQIKLGQL